MTFIGTLREYINHPKWAEVLFIQERNLTATDTAAYIATVLDKEAEVLGYGTHRVTFASGKYAVKIPLSVAGYGDNEREQDLWTFLPDTLKKYVIPCIGGMASCMVYARARLFDNLDDFIPYSYQIQDIKEDFATHNYILSDIEEDQYQQFGLFDGRLVLLDLGGCKQGGRIQAQIA